MEDLIISIARFLKYCEGEAPGVDETLRKQDVAQRFARYMSPDASLVDVGCFSGHFLQQKLLQFFQICK